MNPVSTACSTPSRTHGLRCERDRPARASASKSVTSCRRRRRWAQTRPETPLPTMAIRTAVTPFGVNQTTSTPTLGQRGDITGTVALVRQENPMARYRTTVPSRWPHRRGLRLHGRFLAFRHWDPSVTSARRVGEGDVGLGTTFELVTTFNGRAMPLDLRGHRLRSPAPRGAARPDAPGDLHRRDHLRLDRLTAPTSPTTRPCAPAVGSVWSLRWSR